MEDILHNLLYIYTIPSWEHIHIHIFQCTFESMIFLPISTGAFRRGPKYIPLIPRCTEPFLFGGKDPGECNSVGMMEVCIRIAKSSNMLRLILKIVTDCHSSKVFHGFSICSYGSLSLGNPHFKSLKRQTAVHSPKQAVFLVLPSWADSKNIHDIHDSRNMSFYYLLLLAMQHQKDWPWLTKIVVDTVDGRKKSCTTWDV